VKEPPAEAIARTAARDRVVDEFGPIALEHQLLSARLRHITAEGGRYQTLKAEIRSWFQNKAPDGKFLYETEKYALEISAKENEATADKKAIFKLLRVDRFIEAASITQKACKAELERMGKEGLFTQLFSWKRTGERSVGAIAKHQEAA
jgi:hypothetical protein